MSDTNHSLFSQFWQSFVSDFIDVQKGILSVQDEVKDYHPIVQHSFSKLGWTYDKDLFHHYSLGRKNEQPDFFIKYDGIKGIPIEVKLPNNVMNPENKEQLIEYMRLSDSNIGVYVGECVRVFYRPSLEKELKVILDASFAEGDIEGISFAELFFNGTFDIESLKRNLDKYYEVERLIDEKKVSEIPSRINDSVSNEWIVDRYNKRALVLLQQPSSSIGRKANKKNLANTAIFKESMIHRIEDNNPTIQTINNPQFKNSEGQESIIKRLPNPGILKYEYDLISAYCRSLPNMTLQDWAELAFVEKLHNDGQTSDDEFSYRYNEICSRPPRGKRKGTKTKRK